jgi:transcription-repair coupling factor (superfamily II helicase)
VAAVGFELYCQMLEDAAEELRAGVADMRGRADDARARASATREMPEARPVYEEPREPVRIDVDVDAYLPADYIPFEAAKIDVHRRIAAAREPGELRALREELEDRFGPVPESVSNLLELQRARIALGEAGARTVEFRAGRLRVSPVELDSEQVGAIGERVPEAIYQWRERTIAVPVPEEPGARLGAILALADGLGAATASPAPA